MNKWRKIIRETLQMSEIAFHGTTSAIPFEKFDPKMIGSGMVGSLKKNPGFFFTSTQGNAEYYANNFVCRVEIKNAIPIEATHPPTALSQANTDNKIYKMEDILDGHEYSDVFVVPTSQINNVEILEWIFIGDEEFLFERWDEIFGGDCSQWDIKDTLEIIGVDIDFLLKIPVFSKYFNSKN